MSQIENSSWEISDPNNEDRLAKQSRRYLTNKKFSNFIFGSDVDDKDICTAIMLCIKKSGTFYDFWKNIQMNDKLNQEYVEDVRKAEHGNRDSGNINNLFTWNAQRQVLVVGPMNEVEKYCPITRMWSSLLDVPNTMHSSSAIVLENMLYIIGGRIPNEHELSNQVLKIDPVSMNIISRYNLETSRSCAKVVLLNGMFYVLGGSGHNPRAIEALVEKYDPRDFRLISVSQLPEVRVDAGATTLDGSIYIIGGTDYFDECMSTCVKFDEAANSWSHIAPLSIARMGIAVASFNGYIYAVGGRTYNTEVPPYNHDLVERYDPKTNIWTKLNPFVISVVHSGLYAYKDSLYLIGGSICNETLESGLAYKYDYDNDVWIEMPSMTRDLQPIIAFSCEGLSD